MARIKITGYIDTDELGEEEVDLNHPSGLTSNGHDNITGPESLWRIGGLEDIEVELEL